MKIVTAVFVLGCLFSTGVSAQSLDGGLIDAPVITGTTQVFTKADIKPGKEDFYPDRALNEEIGGVSSIACQYGDDGSLTKCIVLGEKPRGYGFGKAQALAALHYSHAQPFADGRKSGDWARFDFHWTLN